MVDAVVEYEIQNKDPASKLRQTEDDIVAALKDGRRILVQNDSDYAVAATTVVEKVKDRLRSAGTKVYQANKLEYEPVLAPENPAEPLAKRKTHHYKIKLAMLLSKEPILDIENATLQESLPTSRERKHDK